MVLTSTCVGNRNTLLEPVIVDVIVKANTYMYIISFCANLMLGTFTEGPQLEFASVQFGSFTKSQGDPHSVGPTLQILHLAHFPSWEYGA